MEAGWYSFFLGFEAYLNEPYCENVYEEGITYFGEQVSTSLPTHLCDQQMEKKILPILGGGGHSCGEFCLGGKRGRGGPLLAAIHILHTGWFFSLVPPNFSTKNKTAKQPITAAVPVYPPSKKGRDWLLGGFLFGTEKNHPVLTGWCYFQSSS